MAECSSRHPPQLLIVIMTLVFLRGYGFCKASGVYERMSLYLHLSGVSFSFIKQVKSETCEELSKFTATIHKWHFNSSVERLYR